MPHFTWFAWQQFMGVNIQPYYPPVYSSPYPSAYAQPVPVPATSAQPPQIAYATPVPYQPMVSHPAAWLALSDSLAAGWTLCLAAISGFIAAYIYAWTRPSATGASPSARQIVEQELRGVDHGR